MNALISGVLQSAGEGISAVARPVGRYLRSIQPIQNANEFTNHLTGGLNVPESAMNVARRVQNSYRTLYDPLAQRFNDFFANRDLIDNPEIRRTLMNGRYLRIPNRDLRTFSPNVREMHNRYVRTLNTENPSLNANNTVDPIGGRYINDENANRANTAYDIPINDNEPRQANSHIQAAHKLQSQIGHEKRALQSSKNLDPASTDRLQRYIRAQRLLKSDMYRGLHMEDPDLAAQYSGLIHDYRRDIGPYHSNKDIAGVVHTRPENLSFNQAKNIHNQFIEPANQDMQKIITDIGPEVNRDIAIRHFSPLQGNATTANIANVVHEMNNSGFGRYVPQEVPHYVERATAHEQAMRNSNKLRALIPTLASGVGAKLGGTTGAMAAASLAYPFSDYSINLLNALTPAEGNRFFNTLARSYQPLVKTSAAVTKKFVNKEKK
jgi:hypothetical protein